MRQFTGRILGLAGALVIAGPMIAWAAAPAPARMKAPPTKVTTLDGRTLDLDALKGRIVIIDFWATWCPPCRMESPHFVSLYKTYQPRVEILGISLDQQGASVVGPFVKAQGITYPVAMGQDGALANAYGGVRGIPTTFVIDQQGQIYKKYVGYQDADTFEADIKALLQDASSPARTS